ncbi:MAG: hypothetical protein H6631_18830 [Anaerolineaceae bacterium]|nr:hypothetical protein [Anaerolineaceae bacterium]
MSGQMDMPKDFPKRIHQALRAWHTRHGEDPLGDLLLAKQIRTELETVSPRLISNQILLAGLERLKQINPQRAELLQRRFLDQEKARKLAVRWNVSQDMIFQQQRPAIEELAEVIWQQEWDLRRQRLWQVEARLEARTYSKLFGVVGKIAAIRSQLESPDCPWLIALEGLGGIGKTALADALVRELALTGPFKDIIWVTAKQRDFLPAMGIRPTNRPALDIDTLVNSILHQIHPEIAPSLSPQAKLATLTKLLQDSPYLIIIDNLETVVDYQTLLPTLRKLANPSRFLLTSRHSLRSYTDIFCYNLQELTQEDALAFLKYEAQIRGLPTLAKASHAQLDSIYAVVGGNPLALKLIIGQTTVFPLPQVLDNLKQVRGKKMDELYTYIYWHAWHALDAPSQQILLAMPLAQEGDLDQLAATSQMANGELYDALDRLVMLSLVEVHGGLADHRYSIHRLTESFLLTEVVKWRQAL